MKKLALAMMLCVASCSPPVAYARDNGQWDATNADVQKWFKGLMQPDLPTISCCGEADAYYADSWEVEGDHYVAVITDTRPDAPLHRPHIEVGTRIRVPNHKMKFDAGNPTGHGVVFVVLRGDDDDPPDGWHVYCYITPGGA
jgi:hypothetical protein